MVGLDMIGVLSSDCGNRSAPGTTHAECPRAGHQSTFRANGEPHASSTTYTQLMVAEKTTGAIKMNEARSPSGSTRAFRPVLRTTIRMTTHEIQPAVLLQPQIPPVPSPRPCTPCRSSSPSRSRLEFTVPTVASRSLPAIPAPAVADEWIELDRLLYYLNARPSTLGRSASVKRRGSLEPVPSRAQQMTDRPSTLGRSASVKRRGSLEPVPSRAQQMTDVPPQRETHCPPTTRDPGRKPRIAL
jgi:hypothetical protein